MGIVNSFLKKNPLFLYIFLRRQKKFGIAFAVPRVLQECRGIKKGTHEAAHTKVGSRY